MNSCLFISGVAGILVGLLVLGSTKNAHGEAMCAAGFILFAMSMSKEEKK